MSTRSSIAGVSQHTYGFSLVELVVVIAIIGVLVSLLLPATQMAREAARRIRCTNNLRQIGLALHQYHDIHGALPPGCVEKRHFAFPQGRQWAWSALVLAYIEQSSLYAQLDFDAAYDDNVNRDAAAVVLPVYLCPSTSRLAIGRAGHTVGDKNGNGSWDPGDGAAVTDYGGNYGAAFISPTGNGTLIFDRGISISDIRDGTSNTILVGEDTGRGWQMDGQWTNGENIFDQAGPVNVQQHNELWSDHPGGVNVLTCDGSARFLSETTSMETIRALCTRNGGEVFSWEN